MTGALQAVETVREYDYWEQRSLNRNEVWDRATEAGLRLGATTTTVATVGLRGVQLWPEAPAKSSLGYARQIANLADVEFQQYSNRGLFITPGQAHHLNPPELFGGTVLYDAGVTTPLVGNAVIDVDTPHFTTHRGLEAFFDMYRPATSDGVTYPRPAGLLNREVPSFSQVNRALYNSLQEAGVPSQRALRMVIEAKAEQLRAGFRGGDTVLDLPRRLGQRGGP